MGLANNQNNFFGIRVSIPGVDVNNASPSQLLYENNYSTTTWRDSNGNIQLQEGDLGNGVYGLSAGGGSVVLDASGLSINSSTSSNGVTITNTSSVYWLNNIPQIIIGILPDGTVGIVQSITGVDVTTLFS